MKHMESNLSDFTSMHTSLKLTIQKKFYFTIANKKTADPVAAGSEARALSTCTLDRGSNPA
jgi:hypothetical protein